MTESCPWDVTKAAVLVSGSRGLILGSRRVLDRSLAITYRTLADIRHSRVTLSVRPYPPARTGDGVELRGPEMPVELAHEMRRRAADPKVLPETAQRLINMALQHERLAEQIETFEKHEKPTRRVRPPSDVRPATFKSA